VIQNKKKVGQSDLRLGVKDAPTGRKKNATGETGRVPRRKSSQIDIQQDRGDFQEGKVAEGLGTLFADASSDKPIGEQLAGVFLRLGMSDVVAKAFAKVICAELGISPTGPADESAWGRLSGDLWLAILADPEGFGGKVLEEIRDALGGDNRKAEQLLEEFREGAPYAFATLDSNFRQNPQLHSMVVDIAAEAGVDWNSLPMRKPN
jgi:hypothetical protein